MPRKPLIVVPEHQELKENLLRENFSLVPEFVTRFFVSNIFQRSLSHLIGWSDIGSKRLLCTTAGILKTAPTGTGLDTNDTKSGTAADAYGTAMVFDSIATRVDIWITTFGATIQRSKDGVTFDDEIVIPVNVAFSFDCTTHSIKIKNTGAGSNATYQIMGWF